MQPEQDLTFEQAVTRLESIVGAMEDGSLSLDDCLRQFEEAVALSRVCAARLESAEKQITVLTTQTGLSGVSVLDWAPGAPMDTGA
jgi:exodeoxyribonuclease VII small subunit